MWDNAKFKSFCADVCATYDAHKTDVYNMVAEESKTIEAEYKRAGRRLTYRATVEATHKALLRCDVWLRAPRMTATAEHIATLRSPAIYFGILAKKGDGIEYTGMRAKWETLEREELVHIFMWCLSCLEGVRVIRSIKEGAEIDAQHGFDDLDSEEGQLRMSIIAKLEA